MTDRYDVTHLQKQIFFSQLKEFFELIVVYSVYCIIHLEMFIDFFFRSIQSSANIFSSKTRQKKWRIWVSIPVPPAC